jgi:hypothetical protein
MGGVILPTGPQIVELQPGRIAGLAASREIREMLRRQDERIARGEDPIIAGAASFSDYAEGAILEHVVGKTTFTKPTTYLALCTTVPTDASTGTTIVEASYTGYARKKVEGTEYGAASGGAIKNSGTITFAECTAGSSVIKGWALCDALTVGNVLAWGTATETTISTTQTPATISANNLEITLD